MEFADSFYHDSVSKLDQIRIQWERDMNHFCMVCISLTIILYCIYPFL